MLLGCIGDDFTGSTDLANMLVRGGMSAIQTIGVPVEPLSEDVDACVVALKSRTIPAADAVAQSTAALAWLRRQGCRHFYFKYCSTFDSTPAGNIGPVTEALMTALADLPNADFTIACPAFPENGRTIFRGHLFTGDTLLSESGMKDHPLTPMTDSNLVRVLQAQSTRRVGLIRYDAVAAGVDAIRERMAALRADGVAMAVVDAVSETDLERIAAACMDLPLVTAGSGLGLAWARHARAVGWLRDAVNPGAMPAVSGSAAVISGSCSTATNAQVAHWLATRPGFRIDPVALAAGEDVVEKALSWSIPRLADGPVLLYATSAPAEVRAVQSRLGVERAGALVEAALARIAQRLADAGVRRLVVAGGETSGAVVQALGVTALRIGPQIDPGVPWTESLGPRKLALALKSGNFGTQDFFAKALAMGQGT